MDSRGVIVRPARPEDAPQAAYLMYLSGPGPSETIWGGPASNAIRVWRELFPIPNHMYSYSHALVAEWDGQVVGLLLGLDPQTWKWPSALWEARSDSSGSRSSARGTSPA